jgi:hypothetical protein
VDTSCFVFLWTHFAIHTCQLRLRVTIRDLRSNYVCTRVISGVDLIEVSDSANLWLFSYASRRLNHSFDRILLNCESFLTVRQSCTNGVIFCENVPSRADTMIHGGKYASGTLNLVV